MDIISSANGQRQTKLLKHEISIMCGTKPRTTHQKISRLLMRPEQVKKPKSLQAVMMMMTMMINFRSFAV